MSSEAAAVRASLRLSSGCAFLSAAAVFALATTLPLPPLPAQEYVYIKRLGGLAPDEVFAPLSIDGVASVGLLAERACAKFGWGIPTQMRLYLVTEECARSLQRGGSTDGIFAGDALFPVDALERAGVVPGSCLLARVSQPAAAAGASCRRAPYLSGTHIHTRHSRRAARTLSITAATHTSPPTHF